MSSDKTYVEALAEVCGMEGPLSVRLSAITTVLRAYDTPVSIAYDELIAKLSKVQAGSSAPAIGSTLPSFMLPDQDGKLVILDELLKDGPLVVSFNRGHWCPYCDLELSSFVAAREELSSMGATVVSIMPERLEHLLNLQLRHGTFVRYLSDMDNGYALQLGLAIWVGERVQNCLLADGLDLQRFQDNSTWFLPIPATFVVGRNGIIRGRFVDPDFRNRMVMDDIIKSLQGG